MTWRCPLLRRAQLVLLRRRKTCLAWDQFASNQFRKWSSVLIGHLWVPHNDSSNHRPLARWGRKCVCGWNDITVEGSWPAVGRGQKVAGWQRDEVTLAGNLFFFFFTSPYLDFQLDPLEEKHTRSENKIHLTNNFFCDFFSLHFVKINGWGFFC